MTDVNGRDMRQLDGPGKAGMNRVLWPLGGGGGRGAGDALLALPLAAAPPLSFTR